MKLIKELNPPALILGGIVGVVATFVFLESQGLVKHNENKDDYALSQYQAIFIDAESQQQYLLSRKPSNQHARCVDGYLFIRSDDNQAMQGLIVDYKNRGVKCVQKTLAKDQSTQDHAPSEQSVQAK